MSGVAPPALAFDLDGTLVDSAADIQAAVNRTFAADGHAPLPLPQVKGFIGNGVAVLIERVMAAHGISPDADRHRSLTARFESHYGESPADLTAAYPGVEAAVRELSGRGHRLGVCTNKPAGLAGAVLAALGLAQHFEIIVGGDSLPVRKPDPEPLLAVQRALGPCLYVGDSEVDAETAARAGIPFLLFLGGYRRAPLADLRYAAAFAEFSALPALVREWERSTAAAR